MRIATSIIVLFATFATAASTQGAAPSPPRLPPKVQAALKKNASLFSNVLITGERSRRLLVPEEEALKTLQTLEPEAEFTQRLRFELRFLGPQFRESIEYLPGETSLHDMVLESSYDGETFRLGFKYLTDLPSSSVHIYDPVKAAEYARKHDEPRMFNKMEFWYLFETGFAGPQTISELGQPVESMILSAADRQQLVSVSEGAQGNDNIVEVVIEQAEPWQSLETFDIESHEEYRSLTGESAQFQMRIERERRQLAGKHRLIRMRLNKEIGYAVEEIWVSRKETGAVMFHTKNSDFLQIGSDGVWMPKRCAVESHAYWTSPLFISTEPLYETRIQMDQCQQGDFAKEELSVWYDTPGVTVSDWSKTKSVLDDPETHQVSEVIDEAPEDKTYFGLDRMVWLIILNTLLVVGFLVWWFLRTRKKTMRR